MTPGPLGRSTPLKRTKPLARGVSQLARTAMPARTKRIAPRSDKRAKLYREERAPLVARLLTERPGCEACIALWGPDRRVRRSRDVHEVKSRGRGGSITDVANLRCVCAECHRFITEHASDERVIALGLSAHSWS